VGNGSNIFDILTLKKHPKEGSRIYRINVALSLVSQRDHSYHKEGESCVAIWSRYPLRKITTRDPIFTACAEIQTFIGPVLIYGTIITYGADGVREGEARQWERHRLAVHQQTTEWQGLKERYPDHLWCVAGDFNMNLDGRQWYGVKDAKEGILKGLEATDLQCVTTCDFQSPPYQLSRSSVDHICLSENIDAQVNIEAWEDMTLSDHNGVLADIRWR
jgi:hypothetical protein